MKVLSSKPVLGIPLWILVAVVALWYFCMH
jgi:hypothetical protein